MILVIMMKIKMITIIMSIIFNNDGNDMNNRNDVSNKFNNSGKSYSVLLLIDVLPFSTDPLSLLPLPYLLTPP